MFKASHRTSGGDASEEITVFEHASTLDPVLKLALGLKLGPESLAGVEACEEALVVAKKYDMDGVAQTVVFRPRVALLDLNEPVMEYVVGCRHDMTVLGEALFGTFVAPSFPVLGDFTSLRVELHHGGTDFLDTSGLASLLTHSSSSSDSAHQPATFDITVIEHVSWRDTLVSFSSAFGPCRIASDEGAVINCGANADGQEAQWRARLLDDGRWLLLSGEPSFSVNGETGEVSNGLAFEWEAEMYPEPTLEA